LAWVAAACRSPAPQPTSPPPASPTPAPALPANVLYQDDFTDPNSGWPKVDEANARAGYHPPDFYHLEVKTPNDHLTVFREQVFDDATVEMTVLVDHADSPSGDFRYGLALRGSGEAQYYAFLISPRHKSWQIVKHTPEGVEVLQEGAEDSIQGLNAPDVLRVDASGANFTFHINNRVIARVHDSAYTSGQIGFTVETLDETLAHIHYDALVVRQVEIAGLLYQDDFTDPASGWPQETGEGFKVGYHPPDVYHVEASTPNSRRAAFAPNQNFDDFTAEAEVFVDHPDAPSGEFRYGLALRGSGEQYYAFTLAPRTKSWQALKVSGSGAQVLAEGRDDSIKGLVGQSAADHLRVDASGSSLTFHINQHAVAQVNDPDYTSGAVGFVVELMDQPLMHVHFESLIVREVEVEEVALSPTATAAPPTEAPTLVPILPPPPEGMALIPAGFFVMGSSSGPANERPEHPVLLDAFYMDRREATNAQYRACVAAGGCTPGQSRSSATYTGYRDDPAFDNYPVIGVDWTQADAYCNWAGKRLPTEAEWEYAASGPENFTWPWGNTFDASLSAASANDVQAVGSYPGGASPFGILDMAGNVTEWVADVYDPAFYADSPASNPRGEGEGPTRIYRGGSFGNPEGAFYTTSRRYLKSRSFSDVDIGFRCAQEAPEVNAATPPAEREALAKEFCEAFAIYKPGAPCP